MQRDTKGSAISRTEVDAWSVDRGVPHQMSDYTAAGDKPENRRDRDVVNLMRAMRTGKRRTHLPVQTLLAHQDRGW